MFGNHNGLILFFLFLFAAAIVAFSLMFALEKGGEWERKNPSKLGFKWGYFFIISTLIGNELWFAWIVYWSLNIGSTVYFLYSLANIPLLIFVAMNAMKRKKWALVLITLLSVNVVGAVINFFYLRNRWAEFTSERAQYEPTPDTNGSVAFRSLSKQWRLAIFSALCWVLAVGVFIVLFEPYGQYMHEEDFLHCISVMLLPPCLAIGLYWVYFRYVR